MIDFQTLGQEFRTTQLFGDLQESRCYLISPQKASKALNLDFPFSQDLFSESATDFVE
jgi:hypothetical protein